MGKLERMMSLDGGNVAESVGIYRGPQVDPMSRPSAPPAGPASARLQGVVRSKDAVVIPLDRIGPDPDQPRKEFDPEALGRLAESLKARGQLQPIRVRWDEPAGAYVVVVGERRWRAAGLAGLPAMNCVIVDGPMSPGELLMIQVVENALREDLRPVEQARAYRALMDLNGWSTHQVARELAVDQSSVVQSLRLIELPAAVQERVEQGALAPSAAYEVSKLPDADAQVELADRIVSEGMSRAETREAVRRVTGRKAKGGGASRVRKATSKVFRKMAGHTVTVENGRGVDPAGVVEALELALAAARAEVGSGGPAAA